MSKQQERRKHRRLDTRFGLKLGPEGDAGRETIATEGLNISMGGFYCRVPRFVPVMTKLKGTLVLPTPSPEGGEPSEGILDADMIVVWSDPESEIAGCDSYQIGCSFLFLDEKGKDLLQRHLDHVNKEAFA
ncbi:MAG: PilZ domain-containing protein [Candidatus Eisenbacteria bacterium]